jgi:hypothetical protein
VSGAELAARRTAAAAVLGDFRAACASAPVTSPPPMGSWALRLASSLGDLLAGLSRSALPAPALTAEQLGVLRQALADAAGWRRLRADARCEDCMAHPAGLCFDHAADLDKADAYLALAAALGIEVER